MLGISKQKLNIIKKNDFWLKQSTKIKICYHRQCYPMKIKRNKVTLFLLYYILMLFLSMYSICINVTVKSMGYARTYYRRYTFNITFKIVVILTKDWILCHFGEGSVSWLGIVINSINNFCWINITVKRFSNTRPKTETLRRSGEVPMVLFWLYRNGCKIYLKITIFIKCLQNAKEVAGDSSTVVWCHFGEGSTLRLSLVYLYHNINELNHTNNTNTYEKTIGCYQAPLSLLSGLHITQYNHTNNNG